MSLFKNIVRALVRKEAGYVYQNGDIRLSVKRGEPGGIHPGAYFLRYQKGADVGTNLFMNSDDGLYMWYYAPAAHIIDSVLDELGIARPVRNRASGQWVLLPTARQTSPTVTIDSLWGEL